MLVISLTTKDRQTDRQTNRQGERNGRIEVKGGGGGGGGGIISTIGFRNYQACQIQQTSKLEIGI